MTERDFTAVVKNVTGILQDRNGSKRESDEELSKINYILVVYRFLDSLKHCVRAVYGCEVPRENCMMLLGVYVYASV